MDDISEGTEPNDEEARLTHALPCGPSRKGLLSSDPSGRQQWPRESRAALRLRAPELFPGNSRCPSRERLAATLREALPRWARKKAQRNPRSEERPPGELARSHRAPDAQAPSACERWHRR